MAIDHQNMIDPRRRFPDHPVVDADSAAVTEEAVHSLTMLRSPFFEGDALARLHALRSLVDQAHALMTDAVIQARDQECSWSDVAAQLDISPATARRHFRNAPRRRPPLDLD
jgi:chloramphenicol 3-O-phosphotransferase